MLNVTTKLFIGILFELRVFGGFIGIAERVCPNELGCVVNNKVFRCGEPIICAGHGAGSEFGQLLKVVAIYEVCAIWDWREIKVVASLRETGWQVFVIVASYIELTNFLETAAGERVGCGLELDRKSVV